MSAIDGTIRTCNLVHRAEKGAGTTTRDMLEVWEISADFAAYTGSTDTATLGVSTGIVATINARARDGRTRAILWGAPAYAGADANNQPVLLGGTSVAALTISSDTFTGQLNAVNTVATEVTATSGTTKGVGIFVGIAVT